MPTFVSRRFAASTTLLGIVGLVACGTATDRANHSDPVATSTEALTGGPTTYTINVTLPAGTSIVDTTVGSSGAVAFGPGDSILGPTASAAGTVEVAGLATSEAITASGNVQVDLAAVVNGNITAGGLIFPLGQVNGTQSYLSTATKPYTATWTVTNPGNSQGPITLSSNAIATPTPGVYDAVSVNSGSSLYLHSGTYFFQSLDFEPGANLYVDNTSGPVFLYVTSTLEFRGNEMALDAGIPQLFLGFLGTCEVDLEAPFNGVFIAPNATLVHMADPLWVLDPVKKAAGNTATIYGNWVVVDPGESIRPSGFDWSTVAGFPIPPGGWAANGGTTGTGAPGSGATSGGTGSGGGNVISGTLPPSAVSFHLSSQTSDPNAAAGGTPQTTTATIAPSSQVPFHLPGSFDVGGVLANGTATITFTSCAGPVVTCTYRGGSSSANPTTLLDLEAGRTATFGSCTDGLPATAARCGTNFSMTAQPAPGWPVSLDLSLDDRACNGKADILTPLQTATMLSSFKWPDPGLQNPPTVAEMAADGTTPNLYYGWVYLQNTADLLVLRQLYVHILSRPLYGSELEPFAGQCLQFVNPGDGVGTFVPVLIPGKVYNTILNVQNATFQKNNNVQAGPPFFKAVILRSTTPVDFQQLKQSGFRYLDYEGGPIAQTAMQLQGSAVATIVQNALQFALKVVSDVQNLVTKALGNLDAIFAHRVNITMMINVGNSGTPFAPLTPTAAPTAIRGWGTAAGLPLGAGGLKVTILENLHGLIPETFSAHTDDSGHALVAPAKHSAGDVSGTAVCVNLQNDAAWASSFLMPIDVCNLQVYERGALGIATTILGNPVNGLDVSADQTLNMVVNNPQMGAVYGMTDAFKYMKDVAGYPMKTAHALVGDPANIVGTFHEGRAITFGLHLRNESAANLFNLLSPYINSFGDAALLDQISTGGALAPVAYLSPLGLASSFVLSTFANNDIIFPDSSIDDSGEHREVGSHEFGHFILLSLMHDTDMNAIDDLIGDEVQTSGVGNHNNYPTRYVNEAFADYISGQVTGIANYQWLDPNQGGAGSVCRFRPCFDQNFATPVSSTFNDKKGIARVSSQIHDAFDGQLHESNRQRNQPDNADPWSMATRLPDGTVSEPPYTYTATPWGDWDGPDLANGVVSACRMGTGPQVVPVTGTTPVTCVASESVAMPGSSLVEFGHQLPNFAPKGSTPYLQDQAVAAALDKTMLDAGYNWCQRCQVLALHVTENSADSLAPGELLKLCYRGDGSTNEYGQWHFDEDPSLLAWQLPSVPSGTPPPDRDVRLDASTCMTCPANKFPDGNGQCTLDCPADFVIDGSTAPFTNTTETVASGAQLPDACPGLFILEVDHPDQFFGRGGTSISALLSVDSPSAQTCAQSFSLTFADEPASSTTGFVVEQSLADTGAYGTTGFVGCSGVPKVVLSTLPNGPAPLRFITPVLGHVSFTLAIGGPAPQ